MSRMMDLTHVQCIRIVYTAWIMLSLPLVVWGQSEAGLDPSTLQNVSKTIENLLEKYDIRLRPQFGRKYSCV